MHILLTGATGYIGSRLVVPLLDAGHRVRCFVRDADGLRPAPWADRVEIAVGDVLEADTLAPALDGIDAAYYLIHSMTAGEEAFAERDRTAARSFARAAERAGLHRIVYLGGVEPKQGRTSKHLRSRLETGKVLREGTVPVTEFRAAAIVGSGSLSFELVRYLTERLPVMTTPRWVRTPTQPIAVDDVVEYLVAALETPESAGRIVEIGGRDVLSYGDMIREYARIRGLRRWLLSVPVLTPRLSSLWVGLVTPLDVRVARPIIQGLDSDSVADDSAARALFDVRLKSYEEAVRATFDRFDRDGVITTFDRGGLVRFAVSEREGLIRELRQVRVRAPADRVFAVIESLGGDTGWLFGDWLWRLRGTVDRLFGGVGMRRAPGPRGPLAVGDRMDFWTVEVLEANRLVRLRADMAMPGRSWLQYEIRPTGASECVLTQASLFEPRGVLGLLYWYGLRPMHRIVFGGLVTALGRKAEHSPRPSVS